MVKNPLGSDPGRVRAAPRTISETRGFLKAVIGEDDRILGFTMFGPEAGEVMTVVQMAMMGGMLYTALKNGVIAHPTMAEGLNVQFSSPLVSRHVQEAKNHG